MPLASLAVATACLLLGSCASTTVTPPPPGSAIIDAKPDAEHRQDIEGIELVSINGRSVTGTRSVIKPGPNTVKTRFRWPQGQVQEADLRFYAAPGTVYFINYDVYPPYKELTNSVAGRMMNSMGGRKPSFLALPQWSSALVNGSPTVSLRATKPRPTSIWRWSLNQTPYTGWSKRRYDNFKLKTLAHCRGGKPDGPYAEWHANGQPSFPASAARGRA